MLSEDFWVEYVVFVDEFEEFFCGGFGDLVLVLFGVFVCWCV